jgi:ABC-2 type transport system permease protein
MALRIFAMMVKEFRHVLRDKRSLGIVLFIPALMLVLYGYALTFDVRHINMAVLDWDRSPESRDFIRSIFQNQYFSLRFALSDLKEADPLLERGRVRAVLVIPRNFGKAILREEEVRVQVLVDGVDSNSANTTIGYIKAIGGTYSRRLLVTALRKRGLELRGPEIVEEARIWYNPELDSAKFLIPGLMGLILMISSALTTAMSVVREKETKTMEQIIVSPVRPFEIVLGKILPYVGISLVSAALILVLGGILFNIVIRGSIVLLFVSTLVFLFCSLGVGLLISTLTNSQQVAYQISVLTTFLPTMMFSGLVFPIKNMPVAIQWVTYLVPPRYYIAILRAIILKGVGLSAVGKDLTYLTALGFLILVVSGLRLRKRGA